MSTRAAVLAIDVQVEFLGRTGLFQRPVDAVALMGPLRVLIEAARSGGHRVVWVESACPERSRPPEPRWPERPPGERFAEVPMNSAHLAGGHSGRPCCAPGSAGAAPWPEALALAEADDLRVTRDRYSAFNDTDLALRLREQGIGRLVICGAAADVGVRATAADAFFLGFEVAVAEDAVGATSASRMREGLEAIRRWYGEVLPVCGILSRWGAVRAGLGSGDSRLCCGVLPPALDGCFAAVRDEVDWQQMHHRGGVVPRRVALQGRIEDGRVPIYRHPADQQPPLLPFTPAVESLCRRAEEVLGQRFNHVLIQRYPDGASSIRAHADKTLDIAFGTAVVNLSLGATRTLILAPKDPAPGQPRSQRIELPHGSLFVLGWETNRRFQHAIRPDGRSVEEKRQDELLEGGERISLTFRTIATFRLPDGRLVGQGARTGPPVDPREEAERLLIAFRRENRESGFDWQEGYGGGFEVVDLEVEGG